MPPRAKKTTTKKKAVAKPKPEPKPKPGGLKDWLPDKPMEMSVERPGPASTPAPVLTGEWSPIAEVARSKLAHRLVFGKESIGSVQLRPGQTAGRLNGQDVTIASIALLQNGWLRVEATDCERPRLVPPSAIVSVELA